MTALETIILKLPKILKEHSTDSSVYEILNKVANEEVKNVFFKKSKNSKSFAPFGEIIFPYFQMGVINSLDLFGLDELIIFSFYWANRKKYKNVLDLGGNIGLHSIVMSRCGYNVKVFEPDPVHFDKLVENLSLNNCTNVVPIKAAVSNENGTAEFVRVLGNTTSSHIKGSKVPYGDLETFSVQMINLKDILDQVDLIKMDVEGHEKDLLLSMNKRDFENCDIIVEIGSTENANSVFNYLQKIGINSFSQKTGWEKVKCIKDVPVSHRDGSLFITNKTYMPWD